MDTKRIINHNLENFDNFNRRRDIVINGMFLNQNNTLLSIATDKGYKIFESYNFLQVSEDDDYQDLVGSLKIVLPFYESHIVFFVGKEHNTTFLSSHLIVWDDIKKMKIGVIMLKENILDAYANKEAIYILVKNKILVFGLKNLNYVYTIRDVDHLKTVCLYLSRNSTPVVIATIPSTRTNQLKITKCIIYILTPYSFLVVHLDENEEIDGKAHYVISTPFQSIYKMNISKKVSRR